MNESNENWPRLYSLPLAHLFPITFRLSSNIETEFHIKVTSIAKPFIWKNDCDICCYLWDYQDQLMWRLCMEESAIRGYMWTQIHRLTRLFPSTSFIQCLHAMTLEHERQILDVVYVRYKLVVNWVVNVETWESLQIDLNLKRRSRPGAVGDTALLVPN